MSAQSGSGMSERGQILEQAAAKAAVLVEALPWMRRLQGAVAVIKYGGSTLAGPGPNGGGGLAAFAQDVVLLASVGLRPVVVHGGGPQIGAWMERLGKEPVFVNGLRVTDSETLEIARMVLVGKVNREIVGALNAHGQLAVGLSGEDAGFIRASAHPGDLGYVGEVEAVDPGIISRLLAQGLIPVVATIASDAKGQAYNINADLVAGALAEALGADKLIYLTDVDGIRADRDDPASVLRTLNLSQLEELLESGALQGGMVPKARSVSRALRRGVRSAHILDGRLPRALLVEIFTDAGIGTMIVGGQEDGAGEGQR